MWNTLWLYHSNCEICLFAFRLLFETCCVSILNDQIHTKTQKVVQGAREEDGIGKWMITRMSGKNSNQRQWKNHYRNLYIVCVFLQSFHHICALLFILAAEPFHIHSHTHTRRKVNPKTDCDMCCNARNVYLFNWENLDLHTASAVIPRTAFAE